MEICGRLELVEQAFVLEEDMLLIPCLEDLGKHVRCKRCNSVLPKNDVSLPNDGFYCPNCIEMGRVETFKKFVHKKTPPYPPVENALTWQGTLTKGQEKISQEMILAMNEDRNFLVHAVTGAGKTEMMFEPIRFAISRGKRVGIAVPRVDVCLELYPRLTEAFSGIDICLLHGRSTEKFRLAPLTICTTHQLLRFYQYFDYLFIDEVDAFPFVNNDQLDFAVQSSLNEGGRLFYMTATPTKAMEEKVKKKVFVKSLLPKRFHEKPLILPQFIWCEAWRSKIFSGKLPREIEKILILFLEEAYPFLIFCPMIQMLAPLAELLHKRFPELKFETVSSIDKERLEKVMQMRKEEVNCLITTTILERGVTFANISVLVIGSNHKVYTTSSLVQIGGRVGRKLTRVDGHLFFVHDGVTHAMVAARKQIAFMNKKAYGG